jgi:hypothetical protein
MEEVSRIKASQPQLLPSQPPSLTEAEMGLAFAATDSNRSDLADFIENGKDPAVNAASSAYASKGKWQAAVSEEETQKYCGGVKKKAGLGLRCFSRCNKRRIMCGRGVRMCRSVRTVQLCVTATAAKEAARVLALEELGVLDRAAAHLMEWLQVNALALKTNVVYLIVIMHINFNYLCYSNSLSPTFSLSVVRQHL